MTPALSIPVRDPERDGLPHDTRFVRRHGRSPQGGRSVRIEREAGAIRLCADGSALML